VSEQARQEVPAELVTPEIPHRLDSVPNASVVELLEQDGIAAELHQRDERFYGVDEAEEGQLPGDICDHPLGCGLTLIEQGCEPARGPAVVAIKDRVERCIEDKHVGLPVEIGLPLIMRASRQIR
jgi:hypothetical protein